MKQAGAAAAHPSDFSAADVRARSHRLIPLSAPVFDHPEWGGDHILNPTMPPGVFVPGKPLRDAAVLVPIVPHEPQAVVIMTTRSAHLPAHPGQIAFPGGKIDPTDADALAAALREAEEEVGLSPAAVEPLGFGPPYLTGSGYRIVPVVALVHDAQGLTPNPGEVDDIFEVPLGHLMTAANHMRGSREWNGTRRYFYEMPYGERRIWGVTAGIIRTLFERLYS